MISNYINFDYLKIVIYELALLDNLFNQLTTA